MVSFMVWIIFSIIIIHFFNPFILDDYNSLSISAEVENSLQENGQDFCYLSEAFVASIALGPCVILLDGLNELGPCHGLSANEVIKPFGCSCYFDYLNILQIY